jgi:hypothetical protein
MRLLEYFAFPITVQHCTSAQRSSHLHAPISTFLSQSAAVSRSLVPYSLAVMPLSGAPWYPALKGDTLGTDLIETGLLIS